MKQIILTLAVLGLLCGTAMAGTHTGDRWTATGTAGYINQATPTGINDAVWATANTYNCDVTQEASNTPHYRTTAEKTDCSGTWKALWDSSKLYILVTVQDNTHTNGGSTEWIGDSIEIYIDPTNAKHTTYSGKDTQTGIQYRGGTYLCTTYGSKENMDLAHVINDGGVSLPNYTMMVTYEWAGSGNAMLNTTGTLNKVFGLTVYVDDADTGTTHNCDACWGTNYTYLYDDLSSIPTVQLAPEPATLALLAIGGIGMLVRRRRS